MSNAISQLARGASSSLLVIGVARILKFLLQLVISRVLGAADYGSFSLFMAVTYLGSKVSSLGIPVSVVRFGSAYASTGQRDKFNQLVTNTIILLIGFSVFMTTCLYIYRFEIMSSLNINKDASFMFSICLWSIPVINIGQWAAGIMRSQSEVVKAALLSELLPTLLRTIFISTGLFISGNLFSAVWGHYAGVFFVFIVGAILVWKMFFNISFNKIIHTENILSNVTPTFTKLISVSSPMMLSGLTYAILLYIDRFMIAYFMDDMAYVGIYSVASTIALQMIVAMMAVNSIFSPMITSAYTLEKIDRMKVLLQRSTWWVTLLSVPICVIIALNAKLLMGVFGDEFTAGANVLIILAAGQFYNMITGPVGVVLQMTGRQKIDLFISLVLLFINVILNILLIPIYGFEGAAIATLTSMVAVHSFRLYVVWYLYGFLSITIRQVIVGIIGYVFLVIGLLINDIPAIITMLGSISVSITILYIVYRYALDEDEIEIVNIFFRKLISINK